MDGPDNPASSNNAERPAPEPKPGRKNNRRNRQGPQDANASSLPRPRSHKGERQARNPRPQNGAADSADVNLGPSTAAHNSPSWRAQPGDPSSVPTPKRGRGAKFNTGLTTGDAPSSAPKHARPKPKPAPVANDLTSILTAALSTPPYPDCPICFSAVHPAQPTWSCSPLFPVLEGQQHCWTTFHLKCIRSWAAKSVTELAAAWAARGEPHRGGEWRCPGCQARRAAVPAGYRCFCGHTASPAPARIHTPHSCASPCTRVRPACAHPCPLLCHPGPCPPCRVTTDVRCGCPKETVLALRCGATDVSCGAVCGRPFACGSHICQRECHTDECAPCAVREIARCWCGKETREVACGAGDAVPCSDGGSKDWVGRFACEEPCGRLFSCGTHRCARACHPADGPLAECPRAPGRVKTCPCGRRPIAPFTAPNAVDAFPARTSCTAPIPTCGATCGRDLPCGHPCSARCHADDCPPCSARVVRPCRCGSSTRAVACGTESDKEVLCEKACTALRACGRHRCLRVCCPLASVAALQQRKGKRRAALEVGGEGEVGLGEERGGLHECDLVCRKMLGCGEHRCEERDHKGACGGCLRSRFEELICPCGRTVLEPPIPCGTRLQCTYQCPRPAPPCGHPRTPHTCHDDDVDCPPCPFLTTKMCMCGKKAVGNVRCSQERVACGGVCGRLLGCGFHHCERLCHTEEEGCGACALACGKLRKLCLPLHHPCTQPCHAPATCDETTPCTAVITVACPCGRIRQPVQCGKSTSSPAGRESQQPRCSAECAVAKRNARLADALGISAESRGAVSPAAWADDVRTFARANAKFLGVVEKAFAEFVASEKKMQVLPHMPPERRKFVHDVAAVYRMDTQMVDQEPHRSVQLLRRFDTRVPSPLLSAALAAVGPPASLGKLADLRTGSSTAGAASSWRAGPSAKPPSSPAAAGSQRAWGAPSTHGPSPTGPPVRAPAPSVAAAPSLSKNLATALSTNPTAATPAPPADVPEDWEDDA
ncbi:hypothetical protein B0H10DRAFT_528771 [Mycena sp. CBHHK59/15]|nr:hypothetical protein B0H10DRAFT_528771 [Mycena sp. CBHHK59/15]